jgi:hypothetical protein
MEYNLIDLVIIPVVGFLGFWIQKLATAFFHRQVNATRSEALRALMVYAHDVVQSCFQQIIKPVWEEFKANPGDANAQMRYENALKLAKARAVEMLKDHINHLPDLISNFLKGKIDDVIESAIPEVKRQNANPTLAKSSQTA